MKIENHSFKQDLKVFCKKAESFPLGVKAAFQYIHERVPYSTERKFISISVLKSASEMDYWAGVTEAVSGDLDEHDFEIKTIPAGNYACVEVFDYMKDVTVIAKAFEFLSEFTVDTDKSVGIEWYQGMESVKCMIRYQ